MVLIHQCRLIRLTALKHLLLGKAPRYSVYSVSPPALVASSERRYIQVFQERDPITDERKHAYVRNRNNKMKRRTAFIQMYRHAMRSPFITAAVIVYLWADSIRWCVRLGEYLFWAIALAVPSLPIAGAYFYFLIKPHSHPFTGSI